MYTVGRLAKKYGLSRSTLLYYDSIGLLHPTHHTKGSYRHYTEEDAEKLERICLYREAGVSLKDIAQLLQSTKKSEVASVLEQRLHELNEEMAVLQNQQHIVANLLNKSVIPDDQNMNRDVWKRMFQKAGISTEEMQRWHADFERLNPESHTRFLRFLHIPEEEIGLIRSWASAPHKILNLKKASEKFMDSFFRIYENVDRKGPGDFESTKRAYALCKNLPDAPHILDIGCGSGTNAVDLATMSTAHITAIDLYEPYVIETRHKAKTAGLEDRIKAETGDMANLHYKPESFDVIWSEGAAYIMGFDAALTYWKQFLKPSGYMVVSEAVWLTPKDEAPEEFRSFWDEAYPAMRDTQANITAIEKAGYTLLGNFVIPQKDWDIFYDNLELHINNIAPDYADDSDSRIVFELTRKEIELYRKYKGYYGYEFYVMQK